MICAILVVFFPLWEKGLISLFARGICASVSSLLNALSLAQRGIALSVGYFSTWTRRARGRNAFAYLSLVTFCNSYALILVFICSPNLSLPFSQKKNSRRKKRSKSRKSWAKSKSKTARSRNGFVWRPGTPFVTTLRDDTGEEPSWTSNSLLLHIDREDFLVANEKRM